MLRSLSGVAGNRHTGLTQNPARAITWSIWPIIALAALGPIMIGTLARAQSPGSGVGTGGPNPDSCVAELNEQGGLNMPLGATNIQESYEDVDTGAVNQLYPQFDTSTDLWYPTYYVSQEGVPCPFSFGGTIPPRQDPTIPGVEDPTAVSETVAKLSYDLVRFARLPKPLRFPAIDAVILSVSQAVLV
jgi:hypothetical protein